MYYTIVKTSFRQDVIKQNIMYNIIYLYYKNALYSELVHLSLSDITLKDV